MVLRCAAAVPHEYPVAAGSIFSASGKYRNCLRINCALPLSETYREALKQIGEAVSGKWNKFELVAKHLISLTNRL